MPRANVKDKRKAQLIGAALESIAKRGLMETTITHISKGAGMSRGIINFYFTSKEMMMREALKFLIDEYESEWSNSIHQAGDDGHRRLAALVTSHFDKKLCSAKRLNVMSAFWGHAATQPAYRNQLEAADMKIETAFTEALAHMHSSSLEDAKHHARQLHALIRGLWLNFMLNPQTVSRESLAEECFSFIERLSGQPVRIVSNQPVQAAAPKPQPKAPVKPEKPKAAKKPKEKKDAIPGQMDIEDLFSKLG